MSSAPDESSTARLGPYTLLRKLGQGGMGEVHLANDVRLERLVAVKVLPGELREDPERRTRFLREARAVAQLSHPNITQIFDVGEADGRDYIAFELVEGRTLGEHIAQHPLPLNELVELALSLADAIAHAHERGIVHRDLKSANVMVTPRGHAKLLDFGLAKLLSEGSHAPDGKKDPTLTHQGAIFGTPGAMSPEQALGKEIDVRSDVFSFGSLLYEMAAGRPAFQAPTVMGILDAVIHREPDPLGRLRPDLPPGFVACVAKALRKDRGERYQTMNDLAADLRHFKRTTDTGVVPAGATRRTTRIVAIAAIAVLGVVSWLAWRAMRGQGSSAPVAINARPAVAVLPFTSIGGSSDDESFSAGLHSDVLTRLAQISSLKVIARTSVLEYATTQKGLRQIGQDLGANAILSGEVQRSGNALRLNLTLHDAASEDSLWADTFNRELTSKDIFAVQTEIAEAVANALQARLSPADKRELRSVPTTNDKAYDAYLTGLALLEKFDGSYANAIAMLESSVALDPNFALAWAAIAKGRGARFWTNDPTNAALLASAFDAARRALELQPDLSEGHLRLGSCHYYARDYDAAEREFTIAERGLPNSADLFVARGALYRRLGRWVESKTMLERAVELSPRDKQVHWSLAVSLLFLADDDEAMRHMELSKALAGSEGVDNYDWIVATNRDGRVPEGAFERGSKPGQPTPQSIILRWRLRIMSHDPAGALVDLESAPEVLSNQWHDYSCALLKAIAHDIAGDETNARTEYETARGLALKDIESHADDARPHGALALALAGLGEREAALTEARRGMEMMPVERDSVVGGNLALDRFYTELRVGALDDAVRTLDAYLARPSFLRLRALMLDPRLDALARHPGFIELRKRKEAR